MPLVLHGGTGIPTDMIKKAIDLGVSKINVNTECQLSFAAATRKYIEEGKDLQKQPVSTLRQARICRARDLTQESFLLLDMKQLKQQLKKKWKSSVPLEKPENPCNIQGDAAMQCPLLYCNTRRENYYE